MKLAIMSLFIYLKQVGLFKVCLVAVFFFFLMLLKFPAGGGMKGLKVKVSCCSPGCVCVQLKAVPKQTWIAALSLYGPSLAWGKGKTSQVSCFSDCFLSSSVLPFACCSQSVLMHVVLHSAEVGWVDILPWLWHVLWQQCGPGCLGAESLGSVGCSGGWCSAVGVAQPGPAAGSHEHKPAAVQQLCLLKVCSGVGCMKSCVPCGWEGCFSPSLSARCLWQPSPCLLHLPVAAKDVSTMGPVSYIEQVAVSINILSPLHSQAVGKCTEQRTGWIHVKVNLQSKTPSTNVLLNHSHFRPRQSPSL